MSTDSRFPRQDDDARSFLGRWARRKSQARQPDPVRPASPAAAPNLDTAAVPDKSDERAPAPAEPADSDAQTDKPEPEPIPSLESLGEESDYARFMAPDIGPELRRLALRKMFKAPAFNLRDGLDDYDEDFTTFPGLGNTLTADMKYQQERLRLAAEARTKDAADLSQATTASQAEKSDDEALADEPVNDDTSGDASHGVPDREMPGADPAPAAPALPPGNPASHGPEQEMPERPDEAPPPIMAGNRRQAPTPPTPKPPGNHDGPL